MNHDTGLSDISGANAFSDKNNSGDCSNVARKSGQESSDLVHNIDTGKH